MRRFASLFGRRGVLAAAAVGVGMLGTQIVLQLLSTLVTVATFVSNQPDQYLSGFAFPTYLYSLVLDSLPFVIGVFLSLWLLAPVAAELHIGHVVTRSLLAVVGGAVIVFLVYFGGGLLGQISSSEGRVFGWAAAVFGSIVSTFGSALSYALFRALSTAISMIPLTVLAGVLLWVWLRSHPAKHPVAGLIDEV